MTRTETFVDAAFAFAVTLLVISIDAIPRSVDELMLAFRGAPAFAASFAIIGMFWGFHHRWSRQYGLDDGPTVVLSFLLVFQVLLYVYPLKMLSSSFFHWISGGWLPAGFTIESSGDLVRLYSVYGIGFAGLGGTIWLLYAHAWRKREVLGLDLDEEVVTRQEMFATGLIAVAGVLSFLVANLLPEDPRGWHLVLPGLCYNILMVLPFSTRPYRKRVRRRLEAQRIEEPPGQPELPTDLRLTARE